MLFDEVSSILAAADEEAIAVDTSLWEEAIRQCGKMHDVHVCAQHFAKTCDVVSTSNAASQSEVIVDAFARYSNPELDTLLARIATAAFHRRCVEGEEEGGHDLRSIAQSLQRLGIWRRLAVDILPSVVQEGVGKYIDQLVGEDYTERHWAHINEWCVTVVQPFVRSLCAEEEEDVLPLANLAYARRLIKGIYAMMCDYASSEECVVELRDCVARGGRDVDDLHMHICLHARREVQSRLLHPGSSTTHILLVYSNAVNVLRLLDSTGVVMNTVCHPIRIYIRDRADSVRCIVNLLTDHHAKGGGGTPAKLVHQEEEAGADSEAEGETGDDRWTKWRPDPMSTLNCALAVSSEWRRSADVMSMLVGIYGTRELFVNEYRQLLAHRLLYEGGDQLRETRYLQVLRQRFTANDLDQCDVMLNDMALSQVCDGHNRGVTPLSPLPVSVRIISSNFWPKMPPFDDVHLPSIVQSSLALYAHGFTTMKPRRVLRYAKQLGTVSLQLALTTGGHLTINVSPVHAAIIVRFCDKETWTLDDLSSSLGLSSAVLRRKMRWWTGVRVINEVQDNTYMLCSHMPKQVLDAMHDEEEEEDNESSGESELNAVEQYWTYLQGMMRNDHVPAERIQATLRLFASPGQDGPSLPVVKAFLQRKVHAGNLSIHANGYKTVKSS